MEQAQWGKGLMHSCNNKINKKIIDKKESAKVHHYAIVSVCSIYAGSKIN